MNNSTNGQSAVLIAEHLTKTFSASGETLTVLRDVSFTVLQGESLAVVGPSGSGKTTLLGLCAGLDRPSSGSVTLAGQRLDSLDEDDRASVRRHHVGFIFQSFQLLPSLTALENVMVPLELTSSADARDRAAALLERVGLAARLRHLPSQLSGGEQQRVALARAFANNPQILFADEPMGNLDAENGARVADLLFRLNREQKTSLILVTHDVELAQRASRQLHLHGGVVVRG